VWVTPDLRGALTSYAILKDARDWVQTSDHVPVMVEMAV
jgi:exodeoxyribonuclease-3